MTDTASDTTTTDTTTDPATPPAADAPKPDTGEDATDWKAEADKFKALARKHEDRAKANANAAKELDQLRQASMSDQEKAVDLARQQARAEALAEIGADLVDAEVRAAVAGRSIDADALLDGLDRSRFIGDNGRPDRDAIVAWVARIVPPKTGGPDLGQGARGQTPLGGDALADLITKSLGH